jgi:restriction endonuclease S subunit
MESKLIRIPDIRKKGAWHFLLYSQDVVDALAEVENSPHAKRSLGDLLAIKDNIIRGFFVRPDLKQEGIPVITGRNISPDGISLEQVAYITPEEHNKLDRSQLKRGDVLVNLLMRPHIAAVYELDSPANVGQHIAILRVSGLILPEYLTYYLNSAVGKELLLSLSQGSVQRVLSVKALVDLPVIVPSLIEQQVLVNQVQQVDQEVRKLEEQIRTLKAKSQSSFLQVLTKEGSDE